MSSKKTTAMEVLKATPKTNCGECGVPACMAFSALVAQGQKAATDCPYIDPAFVKSVSAENKEEPDAAAEAVDVLTELQSQIRGVDFGEASKRLGAPLVNGRLVVHCLGRAFEVDDTGGLHSMCHVNPWVHGPILHYVIHGRGAKPTGEWAAYKSLAGAVSWNRFFEHRCSGALHRLCDDYGDALFDLLSVFGSEDGADRADADRAAMLYPLPGLPCLVRYWQADGEFDSRLTLLFDRCVEVNSNAEWIYRLWAGILEMLIRIVPRHAERTLGL